MADMRNRTPFYGAVPTSKLQADHVFMADGSTLQEQADKKFELIEEITLTEDTAIIERTTEPDGTTYKFEKMFIDIYAPIGTSNQFLRIFINNMASQLSVIPNVTNTTGIRYSWAEISNKGYFRAITKSGSGYANTYSTLYGSSIFSTDMYITALKLVAETDTLPTNSIIKIYAVRA